MNALDAHIKTEMTKEDWIFVLSEKFSADVAAEIVGCSASMIGDKRKELGL